MDDDSWLEDLFVRSLHVGPLEHGPYICFGAFADKQTGTLYIDLTRASSYMSLEGNVCFLIIYHYGSKAILALPISGFDDNTVFAMYKTQFDFLESKGYKIKLTVMDNQCTKQIKTQSSRERGQTHNTDVQGSLHQRPCDDRQ